MAPGSASPSLKVHLLSLAIGLAPQLAVAVENEEQVRAFLEAHPGFLLEHPELVENALAEQQSRESQERAAKRIEVINQLKAFSGIPVNDATPRSGHELIFFGFTHCPDICPTALFNIAQAISLLGTSAGDIHPLFISVDPERDNARALADYVHYFDARFAGVTGSDELLERAEEVFSVHSEKVVTAGGNDGDFGFSHSSWIFLVDSGGQILERFPANSDPAAMAGSILRFTNGEADQ